MKHNVNLCRSDVSRSENRLTDWVMMGRSESREDCLAMAF